MDQSTAIHLIAGGVGGTVGAVVTCPLDVVKTRLQSSVASFSPVRSAAGQPPTGAAVLSSTSAGAALLPASSLSPQGYPSLGGATTLAAGAAARQQHSPPPRISLAQCFRHIVSTEGYRALFKGLGPNLVGVAPTRAIYFCAYAESKNFLCNRMHEENHLVHVLSAAAAGVAAATTTSPIWVVKTRVQLHCGSGKAGGLSAVRCIRNIYAQDGLRGFYRGVTASYFGVSETIVHFVLYETLKQHLAARRMLLASSADGGSGRASWLLNFFEHMVAGGTSKLCATVITYPHEVARTRMREEGTKYRAFFATLTAVAREEGFWALYRGLGVQLLRAIPNTAVMMSFYELTVDVLSSLVDRSDSDVDTCSGGNDS